MHLVFLVLEYEFENQLIAAKNHYLKVLIKLYQKIKV